MKLRFDTLGAIRVSEFRDEYVLTFSVKERPLDVIWGEGRQQHLK